MRPFNFTKKLFKRLLPNNKALLMQRKMYQEEKKIRLNLESIIAHMPGNVYWMDKNCIHLGCNNNVLNMLGLTMEQYRGSTYEELAKIGKWNEGQGEAFKRNDIEAMHRLIYFDFMGNPVLFYRVVFNLIKNALYQIHQKGQGEIYIHAEKTTILKRLIFKDTAGGVTQDLVDGLFKGYHTTKQEGTGIGLAFCKNVMESFGGDITCHLIEGDKIEFLLDFSSTQA